MQVICVYVLFVEYAGMQILQVNKWQKSVLKWTN